MYAATVADQLSGVLIHSLCFQLMLSLKGLFTVYAFTEKVYSQFMFMGLISMKGHHLLFSFLSLPFLYADFLSFSFCFKWRVEISFFADFSVVTLVVTRQVQDEWALFSFRLNFEFWLVQIITDIIRLLQLLLLLILLILLLSCQGPWPKGVTGFQFAFQCQWDFNSFKTPEIYFLLKRVSHFET